MLRSVACFDATQGMLGAEVRDGAHTDPMKTLFRWIIDLIGEHTVLAAWGLVGAAVSGIGLAALAYLAGQPLPVIVLESLACAVLVLIIWAFLLGHRGIRHTLATSLEGMKWWGLCWHLDRMRLNCGERDRERIVSNFSIAGVNRSGRFLVVKEFYVISNTSGRSQPMRIARAEDGYVRGSTVNPIPPGAEIECVTEFADERDETLTPRGMRPEAFRYFWETFTLVLVYQFDRSSREPR